MLHRTMLVLVLAARRSHKSEKHAASTHYNRIATMLSTSLLFLLAAALAASTAHAGSLRGLKTVDYALPDKVLFPAASYDCLDENIVCSGFEHFLQGEEKTETFDCVGDATGIDYTFHASDRTTVSNEPMAAKTSVIVNFMLSTRNVYMNQRSDAVGRLQFRFHEGGEEEGEIAVLGLKCVGMGDGN